MDNIFNLVGQVEQEHHVLEEVNKIQESFDSIKNTYKSEYDQHLTDLLATFKGKMKNNATVSTAINTYVDKYVDDEGKKEQAREELYNILCAEMIDTFIALSHTTSCTIS